MGHITKHLIQRIVLLIICGKPDIAITNATNANLRNCVHRTSLIRVTRQNEK